MATALATFDIGDTRFIGNHSSITGSTAFTSALGAATDPTAVTLHILRPDGTTTIYTWNGSPALLRESVGRFYISLAFDQAGAWGWKLIGTGTVAEAVQGRWYVRGDYA